MKVLVAYASRHGATQGIAERVAATLARQGIEVTLEQADRVRQVDAYDAFVVGGCAYMFHWAKECTTFVRHNERALASRPTWLFSSGPLGTDLVDEKGQDVMATTRPKEFDELAARVRPRDERIFFGAYDPHAKPVGMAERFVGLMPAARNALPAGDFRDWAAIEAWAEGIAGELATAGAAAGGR